MIKILVVDDHHIVRDGIVRILSDIDGLFVVGDVNSGEEAVKMVQVHRPNIVFMDLQMPGIGGMEAMRRILRIEPNIKIIVLTVLSASPMPEEVLEAGAAGYLTKGASSQEMLNAIERVRVGAHYISGDIAQSLALRPFGKDRHSPFQDLSGREMQITLMVINCHKVRRISEDLSLSPKTVNSYRYRIFNKLNISSDMELAILAMQHGIVDVHAIPLPADS